MKHLRQRIQESLALKLGLGILLFAIPIFVASLGVLFLQSRSDISDEARERVFSQLNTTMHRLRRMMSTIETAIEANAWYVAENMQPDSLLRYTARIVALNGNVCGCSVTTEPNTFPQYGPRYAVYSMRKGDSIVSVRETEYNFYGKTWYVTARQQRKACWTDPFDESKEDYLSSDELIASYSKPLYNADGQFVGVMGADLELRTLTQIINTDKPYPDAYFLLQGADGRVYKWTDTFERAEAPAAGSFVCSTRVPGTPWTLKLVCSERDVLKSYYRLTYIIVPLIIVGLLLILLLCSRVVAYAIRPLEKLERQTQLIATGHYDERIPLTKRQDAVGQLQNSFAQMQEALDKHISDIKVMNDEAEHRNEELVEASRMAEEAAKKKTTFIQNLTHQIRTPLNILMGVSQLLSDSSEELPAEERASLTSMMNYNAIVLKRIVQKLYDSSDLGMAEELANQQREEVACNGVVREAIDHTNIQFPDLKIPFETTLPDTMTVHTNHLYLMRSLREILYNSAKYSDGQHIAVKATATDDKVIYTFEDRGPGIADDYREQLFMPFMKMDDLSEGLGLGLPLSKSHLKNLGGDLRLDDSYKDGCRFIIEIPRK